MKTNVATKREPLISIVTINKNNKGGLCRTLLSLQGCRKDDEIEFVFIDGASTDGSVELAKTFYRDSEYISESDYGIYDAMNKGLARATGKYVLWLNSGDELINEPIGHVKARLRGTKSSVVSYGVQISSGQGASTRTPYFPSLSDLPHRTLPHQSTFFHREITNQFGGYRRRFTIVADRELILRMYFSRQDIEVFSDLIAIYYLGGVSSTSDASLENVRVDFMFKLCGFRQAIQRAVQLKGRAVLPRFLLSLMLDSIVGRNTRSHGSAN